MTYVEKNCCIVHEGRKLCAGGAVVTEGYIVAYPQKRGTLTDWRGRKIGTWREIASWPISSPYSPVMYQIEAKVDGVLYTGRGLGISMIYRGKRKASQ